MMEAAGFQKVGLEVVSKTTRLSDVNEIIFGFVDGSPLSSFIEDYPASMRAELKEKLRQALQVQSDQYGSANPLQAIIVEGLK